MTEYKVQIVIPMYNAEKTIDKCIGSIRNQSFSAWQAIVIDDCSRDGSYKRAMELAENDDRIKVLKNEKNYGVSKTRNNALKLIDCEYVTFLDSDDWWEQDFLKLMTDEAEKGYDIVQCRYQYAFSGGEIYVPRGVFGKDTAVTGGDFRRVYIKMLTGIKMNHACCKMIRSSVIKNIEFDRNLKTAEDLDFCVRAFEKADGYSFIDKVLYNYYRGGVSLTGGALSFSEKWKANCRAAKSIEGVMKRKGIKNPVYYALVPLRVYIITASKILRTIRDSVKSKKGGAHDEKKA